MLPLSFEANQGQTDARVKFLSRGPGYTLFLTGDEVALEMQESGAKWFEPVSELPRTKDNAQRTASVLRLKLVGASPNAVVTGADELPAKSNYFIGNDPKKWRSNVPTYAKVKYACAYPGVDLVFYGNQRQLEYDFVVPPGADASRIELRLEGSKKVSLDTEGNLVVAVEGGEVQLQKPLLYQEGSRGRREVPGGYVLKGTRDVAFKVGAYDRTKSLVIDPVLAYSTYLGGSGLYGDYGMAIAADASGSAYVTGFTTSADFPTANPLQGVYNGNGDAFVTKFSADGSSLIYSTFLGGNATIEDGGEGHAIAVDPSGSAYVTGTTCSPDFPTTPGAFQTSFNGYLFVFGSCDAFVSKLNPTGSALLYSTYLGGSSVENAMGIAVDAPGNAYVAGWTSSADFPITPDAFQTACRNCSGFPSQTTNGFVSKLNPSGSSLVYSTFLGGSGFQGNGDGVYAIAVDASGSAYVTGRTPSSDFPSTSGAYQPTIKCHPTPTPGNPSAEVCFGNAFVSKLNPVGSSLLYSTYLGGTGGGDWGSSIAVDASGDGYVTGATYSTDFPITAGAFQTTCAGGCSTSSGFVTKLNANGKALVYSTFIGNAGGSIAVDASGNAYLGGGAAIQTTVEGGYVTELNPTGSAVVYSTYLGPSEGSAIAVDPLGNPYLTGTTTASDFPTTAGAFQASLAGIQNAFVAKLENSAQAQVTNLQSTVKNLVSTAKLSPAFAQLLLGPLNAAMAALGPAPATAAPAASDPSRIALAIRDLHAFIGSVRLLVILGRLTPTEGQTLINAANSLIAELGG